MSKNVLIIDITSLPDLIREADDAMYRAKAAGRNRVFSMNQE